METSWLSCSIQSIWGTVEVGPTPEINDVTRYVDDVINMSGARYLERTSSGLNFQSVGSVKVMCVPKSIYRVFLL